MKLTINVTKKDIEKSKANNDGGCTGCPIYHAIQRVKQLKNFVVGMTSLYREGIYSDEVVLPPKAVDLSINAYARSWDSLKPLKFQVELPC